MYIYRVVEMKSVVTFEDILKTYPHKTQKRTKLYLKVIEFIELRDKYGYGSKKISKMLNISRYKIEGWIYQESIPRLIKAIRTLESLGVSLPLNISKNSNFELFVKIFAFTFGDGGISRDFRIYLTGYRKYLEKIKKEIENTFNLKCKINKIGNKNNKIGCRLIRGKSFSLDIIGGYESHILGRLLNASGAPIGDKVVTSFLVPKWIMKGPKWVKKLFLEVLLGNELQVPRHENMDVILNMHNFV